MMIKNDITEKQFSEAAKRSLRQFSMRISESGISIYKIAQLAGMSWRTVKNAVDCIPIRFDSAERIKYILSVIDVKNVK